MPSAASRGFRPLLARAISLPSRARSFSSSPSLLMVDRRSLKISDGANPEQITEEVTSLIDSGNWSLCLEGKGLERSFKFKGFKATWDFMNEVAAECKKQKHHPEWTNIYNQTKIRWTTHNPEGLSALDTRMAKFCDQAAQGYGEKAPSTQDKQTGDWEQSARECCSKPQGS